jgi:hypothetical protein
MAAVQRKPQPAKGPPPPNSCRRGLRRPGGHAPAPNPPSHDATPRPPQRFPDSHVEKSSLEMRSCSSTEGGPRPRRSRYRNGRAAVVTDDDVRASAIGDGSDAIVSRRARPGSVCIGTPRVAAGEQSPVGRGGRGGVDDPPNCGSSSECEGLVGPARRGRRRAGAPRGRHGSPGLRSRRRRRRSRRRRSPHLRYRRPRLPPRRHPRRRPLRRRTPRTATGRPGSRRRPP